MTGNLAGERDFADAGPENTRLTACNYFCTLQE